MFACPTQTELYGLLEERLDARQAELFSEHLQTCPDCQNRLSQLSDDSELYVLKQLSKQQPFATTELIPPNLAERIKQSVQLPQSDRGSSDSSHPGLSQSQLEADEGFELQIETSPKFKVRNLKQYKLLGEIGQGGFGIVYEALHTILGRIVALKILSAPIRWDQSAKQRFSREMKALGRLDHPNIVRATDADEENGVQFLVLELVDGYDFATILSHSGALPVEVACEVVQQTALGLAYAHEHQMVHRDIKPSNLLLSREGLVKVSDLGLARFLERDDSPDCSPPSTNLIGTADFIAPERVVGKPADIRSDIYSLGATLFALLVNRAMYPSSSVFQRLVAHTEQPILH